MWQISEPSTPCIGIDLGTTNSVVAICEDSKVKVLSLNGEALTKSKVNNYTSFKRHMKTPEILIDNYKTPVELSSILLRNMKNESERIIGKKINKAVITVPAYFDEIARKATISSASIAGIEVIRLLNEPTAAALAYKFSEDGIYAVYDLGGGTFDLTILNKADDIYQVIATGGDVELGGDDIDSNIACHLGCTIEEARYIKEQTKIDRNTIEKLSCPFVDKTISICKRVLKDASLTVDDLKGVILVGGCTRLIGLKDKLRDFFKKEPLDNLNPDTIVACGAAIQAETLLGNAKHLLIDVVPLSLGLETIGSKVDRFINRNTPIPIAVYQDMTTFIDNQTAIDFHVVQGESDDVFDCKTLAKFRIEDLPAKKAGELRVRVNFSIDQNSLLKVSAICDNKSHEVVIN